MAAGDRQALSAAQAAAVGAPSDVLHLDMDAFFASVEVLDDPTLAGKPVVVGGTGGRGVVASASYAARRFGVFSAMSMAEARRRCPGLVAIPGRFGRYSEVSAALMVLLREVTPLVEPVSLDEAYLDVSGAHGLWGTSEQIAVALRRRVRAALGLSCAVGVGRTKLIAKLASKAAKPPPHEGGALAGAGVLLVSAAEEDAFLVGQLIRAIPGVGPRSAERLARYGIATVADARQLDRASFVRLFGTSHGNALCDLVAGIDPRGVEPEREVRSIGHEETFAADDADLVSLQRKARRMADSVATRCRRGGIVGRTVTVKVRFSDFRTVNRSRTLAHPATTGAEIGAVAAALLESLELTRGVRLLGVHVSGLVPREEGTEQLELFPAGAGAHNGSLEAGERERRFELEAAADAVRRRFGEDALGPRRRDDEGSARR